MRSLTFTAEVLIQEIQPLAARMSSHEATVPELNLLYDHIINLRKCVEAMEATLLHYRNANRIRDERNKNPNGRA